MSRAKPGQGRTTLQAKAISMAEDLGHKLTRFHAADGKSRRAAQVLFRGKLIEASVPEVFRAACERCGESAIVDQHQWELDGVGVGGKALRDRCEPIPVRSMPSMRLFRREGENR